MAIDACAHDIIKYSFAAPILTSKIVVLYSDCHVIQFCISFINSSSFSEEEKFVDVTRTVNVIKEVLNENGSDSQ